MADEFSLGICPFCSSRLENTNVGSGIWAGSLQAKATSGPMYFKRCDGCGRKLLASPTYEEAKAGEFEWEEENEAYPGEEFVATMADDRQPAFVARILRLVSLLRDEGFDARNPDHTFAGILVRSAQAQRARERLATMQVDYLRVWLCNSDGRPTRYIGKAEPPADSHSC